MPTDHESDRLGRIQQDGQVRTCIDINADLNFFQGPPRKRSEEGQGGASKQQGTGVLGDQ